jgi:hypothetical protein
VAATEDGIGPLCEVVSIKTMVIQTGDGGLGGGNTTVVTTIVGIEEFPEEVTTFVSIAMCNAVWCS